jgi:uncharacterized lipoprotein NlpE involved in copper resistance
MSDEKRSIGTGALDEDQAALDSTDASTATAIKSAADAAAAALAPYKGNTKYGKQISDTLRSLERLGKAVRS